MRRTTINRALVLRGGTVVDGTGAPRFAADVRIEGERIAAVGANLATQDADVQDVAGKIVAPGFIDVHTHDDQIVLAAPQMLPKISQGVTTVVIGNCGISLAPLVHADAPPPLNLLGAATSTSIRRWPRMSRRSARRGPRSTSRRWSAIRRCAWRRWTIPIVPPRRPSNRGWSSCCAKAWTRARRG